MSLIRTRWAAIGAAVAVTLGAGGLSLVNAAEPAGALTFVPITPCRVLDTRPTSQVGPRNTPLTADLAISVATRDNPGECVTGADPTIPFGAAGVALNVTALNATAPTFLTIFPSDQPRPTASNLNPVPGAPPTPNAVVTDLSPGFKFDVYNLAGTVDVIVDIAGYYIDHTHDDRYYTEAEVDAKTGLVPVAAGIVRSNRTDLDIDAQPTLVRGVGVASVTWVSGLTPARGRYEILLTGVDFSVLEYATTVVPNCPGADASTANGTISAPQTPMYVYIETNGNTDTLEQCSFSFTVIKVPAP
jgi:uncharacterized membrane protein